MNYLSTRRCEGEVQQQFALLYIVVLWTLLFTFLSTAFKDREFKFGFAKLKFIVGGMLLYFGRDVRPRQGAATHFDKVMRLVHIVAMFLGLVLFYLIFIPSSFNMLKGFIEFSTGAATTPPQPVAVPIPLLFTITSIVKYLIVSIAIGAAIHEFAHAVVALREGVGVKNWGVGCIFLIPLAFVELDDDSFKNASPVSRASIASAGPFANALVAIAMQLLIVLMLSSGFALSTAVEVANVNCSLCNALQCPGERLGLRSGDIIYAVNGTVVRSVGEITKVLNVTKLGSTVELTICRNSVCFDGNVTLDAYNVEYMSKYGLAKPCLGIGMQNTVILLKSGRPYSNSLIQELLLYLNFIFIVNFSLFIFNAIPLFITDGTIFLSSIAMNRGLIGRFVEHKVLDKVNVVIILTAIAISTYLFIGV